MSCELRDVSRKMALHSGVYFSSLYPVEGRAMLPKDLPAFSKWNIKASQRIIISIICHVQTWQFKHSRSGSGSKPAILTPVIHDQLWPQTSYPLSFLLGMGSFQTLVPKQRLLLRVKHGEIFFPQTMWAGTQSIFLRILRCKSYGWKLSSLVSIPSYLHLSPNKCGSRQWQLLNAGHHTLML